MSVSSLTIKLESFDPLAAYLHLGLDGPGFLESANPSPRIGRYSILPLRARDAYRLDSAGLFQVKGAHEERLDGDPWQRLADRLEEGKCDHPGLFPGGFFGLFGYDLAGWIEDLPRNARRDQPIPHLYLYWVDQTAVYDHLEQQLTVSSLEPETDLDQLAEEVVKASRQPVPEAELALSSRPKACLASEDFHKMVHRAKEYISAGDIYQTNLSCRFDTRLEGPSWALYHQLRMINPAPFGGLFNAPGVELISASPERLVSLRDGIAETRPIAGTRPRGYTLPEDVSLGHELLAHPKERAEHIMLLDLERNDLGKVCNIGSVEVDELMVLERYSHVTHIVSNVRGNLDQKCSPMDLVRAMFPGGTITGVPKKRCMEIIDELEPLGRGSYTGSIGYISVTGNLDLNILIRGFQRCGQHLSYQVGAGIVADSDPEREWQECLSKGAAMAQTLEKLSC